VQLAKEGNRLRMASYKELEGRLQREQKMRDVAQGMALQKELMVWNPHLSPNPSGPLESIAPQVRVCVNSGQRFVGGLDRGALMESRLGRRARQPPSMPAPAAWWDSVWFIWAVAWFSY